MAEDKSDQPTRLSGGPTQGLQHRSDDLFESEAGYRLRELLTHVYGGGTADALLPRLRQLIARASNPEPIDPAPLTAADVMLITYGDSIVDDDAQPLAVLKRFCDGRLAGLFSDIHVLPFFPFSSDDGFSVVDYLEVRSDLGDWSDVRRLGERFGLMFDLVINHCSREHLWFHDFVNDRLPGRDFFLSLDAETDTREVVRPRNTPLLSEVRTYRGVRHVWTTFSDDQIDLNFANPDVLIRFVEILFDYVGHGARYIRLDAIAFLWKRLGTNCMSLPQTHQIVQALRAVLELSASPVRLLTETNVPHEENVSYFGAGDEAHLVYQFSLAPLLLYAYLFEDGRHLGRWLAELDAPPEGCSYLNFIASHDGVGLRPLEGLIPQEQVDALIERCAERGGNVTRRSLPDGSERAYELNVALFSAFGGNADSVAPFLAAHCVLLALQGLPAIYLHSVLGTPNDHEAVERTGRTRSINRGRWRLPDLDAALDDPASLHRAVFDGLAHAVGVRRAQPAFAPSAEQRVISYSADHLLFVRSCAEQTIVVVAAFAARPVDVVVELDDRFDVALWVDLLTGESVDGGGDDALVLSLNPGQVRWLSDR